MKKTILRFIFTFTLVSHGFFTSIAFCLDANLSIDQSFEQILETLQTGIRELIEKKTAITQALANNTLEPEAAKAQIRETLIEVKRFQEMATTAGSIKDEYLEAQGLRRLAKTKQEACSDKILEITRKLNEGEITKAEAADRIGQVEFIKREADEKLRIADGKATLLLQKVIRNQGDPPVSAIPKSK